MRTAGCNASGPRRDTACAVPFLRPAGRTDPKGTPVNNETFTVYNKLHNLLRRRGSALLAGLVLLPAAAVQAQTTLPPVVVVAPSGAGSNIICRGMACASILEELQAQSWYDMQTDQQSPIEPTDVPVDRGMFCNQLRGSKPAGCGATPAPVPLVNTTLSSYQANYANGCGDGGLFASIGSFVAEILISAYTGDPNNPMTGISFRSVCNVHDACYAAQGDRGACDSDFPTGLANICSAHSGGVRDNCNGFAHAYSAAVTFGGGSAYASAGAAYQCALWHNNMESNQCPK